MPTAVDAPKMPMTVPEPAARRDVADAGEHHARVAELEPDQQHAQRELPRLARQGDAGEHDRLDERAADDDRLAAVLVGPHAPQRHERHADDEDQRAEQPDEREPVVLGHAHLAQVGRDEREDLADAEALDHRGEPEDDEQASASPGRGGAGRACAVTVGRVTADADASLAERTPGRTRRTAPAHTKAPEGTGGRTASRLAAAPNKSGVPALRPGPSLDWPCGHRTWFPGPSRGSLPGAVWRFAPAPSGKTKCSRRGHRAPQPPYPRTCDGIARGLSPTFPPMWTRCG